MGIKLPQASATKDGIITDGTQTIAGNKTFTGNTAQSKSGSSTFLLESTSTDAILNIRSTGGGGTAVTWKDSTTANTFSIGAGAISSVNQLEFVANSTLAGNISAAGAWTIGPTSSTNLRHLLGNSAQRTLAREGVAYTGTTGTNVRIGTSESQVWDAGTYLVSITCNPNPNGSGFYSWSITGLVSINGGFSGSVQQYISWTTLQQQVTTGIGSSFSAITALWQTGASSQTAGSTVYWYVDVTGSSLSDANIPTSYSASIVRIN